MESAMEPSGRNGERQRAAERAAEWLCVLETAGASELAAFADWIRESPLNLREFLVMSAIDGELGRMDPQKRLRVREILGDSAGNVVPLGLESPRPVGSKSPARRWVPAAAAAAIVGLAAAIGWWLADSGRTFTTAAGEQRAVTLADGSSVRLNMRSRVQVDFGDDARDISLLEGEALFKVAPDPQRPFRVRAGDSVIQAIGTQFNVNRRPSGTTVSVVEGKVQIEGGGEQGEPPMRLSAGEDARIANDGRIERRGHIGAESMATWRTHPLVFRDETLEDIASEFNRYDRHVHISLEGDETRARRYTAVFDAEDSRSLVQFLVEEGELDVETRGNEIRIRVKQR